MVVDVYSEKMDIEEVNAVGPSWWLAPKLAQHLAVLAALQRSVVELSSPLSPCHDFCV